MLYSLKIRLDSIIYIFLQDIFFHVPEWWLDAVFAWETTRQEDNMAASEWEDASCLQPCPYVLSVRRWRLSDAGLCFDLAFDHIKNRKHPNQTGIFRVFRICSLECYIFL